MFWLNATHKLLCIYQPCVSYTPVTLQFIRNGRTVRTVADSCLVLPHHAQVDEVPVNVSIPVIGVSFFIHCNPRIP